MRVLQFILIAIFLAVAMVSCDKNSGMSSSMGFAQHHSDEDSSYIMQDSHVEKFNKNNRLKRLNRNLSTISYQLRLIDEKLATENAQLDKNARYISEQLRKDLVRLKKDLETHLSNTANVSETDNLQTDYGIEKLEDEISQIQEEIDDWIEINFEQQL